MRSRLCGVPIRWTEFGADPTGFGRLQRARFRRSALPSMREGRSDRER